jgi:hypothetical protein
MVVVKEDCRQREGKLGSENAKMLLECTEKEATNKLVKYLHHRFSCNDNKFYVKILNFLLLF